LRIKLYRNLAHQYKDRRVWSIVADEGPQQGRVIDVVDGAVIKDATFIVNENRRQRVVRDHRKNVHAYVRGELERTYDIDTLSPAAADALLKRGANVRVGYNPFKMKTFQREDCWQPIAASPLVVAAPKGVYAKLPACVGGVRGLDGLDEWDDDLNLWNG
jgi:hypothetical protein